MPNGLITTKAVSKQYRGVAFTTHGYVITQH